MLFGMALQIFALLMLTVPTEYLSIVFVMVAQALSGIAKDLNKMSAKASIKLFVPTDDTNSASSKKLFKWIAILTGSKNTLKGIGFFLGGLLLATYGFQASLYILAGGLFIILCFMWLLLPRDLGKTQGQIYSSFLKYGGD